MAAQPAAQIQPIPTRYHDVQKKKRRWLALRIRDYIRRRMVDAGHKPGPLQMMLHQPRNINVVFKYKDVLAQSLSPLAGSRSTQGICRPHGTLTE